MKQRHDRKAGKASVLFFLLFFPCMNGMATEETLFRWGLVIRDSRKYTDIIINENEIELEDFQSCKFIFKAGKNTYLYLYQYNDEEGLQLLFPYENFFLHNAYKFNLWYDIPNGPLEWFPPPDSSGREDTFFLLVSKERLRKLEFLTKKLISKKRDKKRIQKEIFDEMMHHFKEQDPSPGTIETPVPIAGTIKGKEPEVFEVKGCILYIKVMTIRYKKPE
jgi:hypothetical protein